MRSVSVIAHRGASGTYPENTASAFQAAIDLRVSIIEFDVRLTRDHRLVIVHDDTVDRTSNGSGRVADLTLAQIREFDAGSWFDPRFAGERFLTLEELLDMAPNTMRLNVHIKGDDRDREVVVPLVVRELVQRGLLQSAFVAGSEATVTAARRVAPDVDICTNLSVARCVAIKCGIMVPANDITTCELVEQAHRHGIEVNPFYADDETEMRRLVECGVDGIMTNFPERLQILLRSR